MDVLNTFNVFWGLDGHSFHLNDAFMILLCKKNDAQEIRDYRPISLMHSFNKLITKCLARRFAKVLNELVQQNQSAFIKGHSIHGNFRSIQLTCKALHAKRDSCLVLKIDVAKAFDSVSGPFLLASLAHLGFSARWRDWTSLLLSTASTRILLNGRP